METLGEIRKTVDIEAPPEIVFEALIDEKKLVQWMPKEAKFDAHIGGNYEFKFHWADRDLDTVLRGRVLELESSKKLSYTWDAEASDHSPRISRAVVTWILDPLPDGKTRVTLIHSGIAKQFSKDAEMGWNYFLANLGNYCKKESSRVASGS